MSRVLVLVFCLVTAVRLDATYIEYNNYDSSEDEDQSQFLSRVESKEESAFDFDYVYGSAETEDSKHSNRFSLLNKISDRLTHWGQSESHNYWGSESKAEEEINIAVDVDLEETDDDFDGDDDEDDDEGDNLIANDSLQRLLAPYINNFNMTNTPTPHSEDEDVEVIMEVGNGIQNEASSKLQTSNKLRLSKKAQYQISRENNKEAENHIRRIQEECNCLKSQPRLVSVQSVYPNYTKQYVPHHTVLYRCSDDVGYCIVDRMSCIPRLIMKVDLYFKVLTKAGIKTEKLSFDNHTECYCGNDTGSDGTTASPIFKSIEIPDTTSKQSVTTKRPSCKCTREFSVHISEDGQCECNCYNKHRDCLRLKKGREYFGLVDRMCIRKGQCQKPVCEFGLYLNFGRCPRRSEQILGSSSTASSRKRRTI